MPNNYFSVLYKHIIQVENENVGLKVGRGHKHTIAPPPPPPPPQGNQYNDWMKTHSWKPTVSLVYGACARRALGLGSIPF